MQARRQGAEVDIQVDDTASSHITAYLMLEIMVYPVLVGLQNILFQ